MNGTEVVATTADPAFAVDRDGRILAWNSGAEECLGYRRSEVEGRHCWRVLRGRDPFSNRYCSEHCPLREMAVRGEPVHRHQMSFRASTNESVRVSISTLVLSGPTSSDKEIVHVLQCLADCGELGLAPEGATAFARGQVSRLTARQLEVLSHLAVGHGTREIAELLGLSPATVRHHIHEVLSRLKVHNRLEAVALARRIGLI